jgi:hypothetical protein
MSESQVASGSNSEGSAEGMEQDVPSKDSVAYDTYRKVLAEKKKRDLEVKDLADRLSQYETTFKQREEEELRRKGELEKILTMRDQELNQTKSKLSELIEMQTNTVKLTTFLDSLGAKVPKKYWDMLPLNQIQLDESGEVDKGSVQKAIEYFKREYPEVIQSEAGPKVSPVSPTTASIDSKADQIKRFASSGLF